MTREVGDNRLLQLALAQWALVEVPQLREADVCGPSVSRPPPKPTLLHEPEQGGELQGDDGWRQAFVWTVVMLRGQQRFWTGAHRHSFR